MNNHSIAVADVFGGKVTLLFCLNFVFLKISSPGSLFDTSDIHVMFAQLTSQNKCYAKRSAAGSM